MDWITISLNPDAEPQALPMIPSKEPWNDAREGKSSAGVEGRGMPAISRVAVNGYVANYK